MALAEICRKLVMKKKFLQYSLLALSLIASMNVSAETKKEEKKSEPAKKEYTPEEFKTAVLEEVTKLMKKAGSAHLVDFSKELIEKESALKVKEQELKKREEELSLSQEDFKKKLVEFQGQQKKFIGCIDEKSTEADQRVSHMVEIISGMKPQTAADVLTVQDPDLAVKILSEIESAKASKIFNLMNKEVSARLQKQFLEMKK